MDPERNEAQRSGVEGDPATSEAEPRPPGMDRFPQGESKDTPLTPPGTWVIYILLCRNGAFYIGVTCDLARRWEEHRTGRGGHYTRCNPPARLVYVETFGSRAAAETRERQLKGWTRRKKQALIAGDLSLLKEL